VHKIERWVLGGQMSPLQRLQVDFRLRVLVLYAVF